MNRIHKIIKEEIIKYLKESDDDNDWDLYEQFENVKRELFSDFLYKNTPEFNKTTPWKVIPYARLKKIWEDFMRMGIVRDTRGLEMIEDIMTENTIKIALFTELFGHTPNNPEEDYVENIGYFVNEQMNCLMQQKKEDRSQLEIPFNNPKQGYVQKPPAPEVEPCDTQIHPFVQEIYNENYDEGMSRTDMYNIIYVKMKDKFFEFYGEDPKSGQAYISDYGLEPLEKYLQQLRRLSRPEDKVVMIDKMLNVVHMRSDMASWFVEGGSNALAQLSGSPSEPAEVQQ